MKMNFCTSLMWYCMFSGGGVIYVWFGHRCIIEGDLAVSSKGDGVYHA